MTELTYLKPWEIIFTLAKLFLFQRVWVYPAKKGHFLEVSCLGFSIEGKEIVRKCSSIAHINANDIGASY